MISRKKNYFLIAGKMITDIQRAWNGLLGAEKGFEEWLLAELMGLGKKHILLTHCTQEQGGPCLQSM